STVSRQLMLSAIGVIALAVFWIDSLPPLETSQAQPEPNCVLPASASWAINSDVEPKSRAIALASSADGSVLAGERLRAKKRGLHTSPGVFEEFFSFSFS